MAGATFTVNITGNADGAKKAFDDAAAGAEGFASKLHGAGEKMASAGKSMTLAMLPLAAAAVIGFKEFAEGEKVLAQTQAVLESTGGAAQVTAGQIGELANALMRKTGVDDEAIASSQNLLLTFTNIRNEVGQGNDVFTQATEVALDLSVALGMDLQSASIMVGKALNDPVAGLTALGRAGVQFTDEQKATITALVETGDVLGAQKIILAELETQVGGSAEAYGKTLPGQIAIAKESLINAAGVMVAVAAPAFAFLAGAAEDLAGFITNLPGPAKDAVAAFAAIALVAGPLTFIFGKVFQGVSVVITVFQALPGALSAVGSALSTVGSGFMALATNPAFLAVAATVAIFAAVSVAISSMDDSTRKAVESGRWLGQALVDAANSSTTPIQTLRTELRDLDADMRAGRLEGFEWAAAHAKVADALKEAERAAKEKRIADKALTEGLKEVAAGTTDMTNATDGAVQALQAMQSQMLAMSGGQIGYQQSLINVTKAQQDLDVAIGEHGPASDQATAASLALDSANLSAASAALGLDDATTKLTRSILETPAAFDAELAKLEESKRLHPEAAAAIQIQIDKLIWLKGSIDAVPVSKSTDIDADTSKAHAKLDRLLAKIRSIPMGGTIDFSGGDTSYNPEGIPGFAAGGVIPGPMGAPQLVLAHGGEAVFNPDQLRALGAGGMSSDVTVVIVRSLDEALGYVPGEARNRTQAAFLAARV